MKLRRNNNFLIEPASAATGDIAFNLIVFFLVCASTQPDSGRKQILPRSENQQQKQTEQIQNLEVSLDRNSVSINTEKIPLTDFPSRIKRKLQGKAKPEDRIVVVKSTKDVPYHHWIAITGAIEDGGGIITLQLEEERSIQVP
ncbi:MAG: Biopolymer transport protein ExbD/TolR [Planctomycetaceae bacterium]|nr:Biopolymer transport protein ExbD/TolR [Planctomycetaceae bacterium]